MLTASNLGMIRRCLGLSGAELATRIGVSPAFLSMVEAGKRDLPAARIDQIERALGLTPETFAKIQELQKTITLKGEPHNDKVSSDPD